MRISLDIRFVVAVTRGTEVGGITEAHLRRDDVPDGHDFITENFSTRGPETVELRIGRHTHPPIVHVVEAIRRVGLLHLSCHVPRAHHFVGIHPVGERERRIQTDELQHCETSAHWNTVLHTVAPILDEVRPKEPILLRRNRVTQLSRIAQCNLLVPPFFPRSMPTFKGIEPGDGDVKVGQCHGY